MPVDICSAHASVRPRQTQAEVADGLSPAVFPSFSHEELASLQNEDETLKVIWSCWKRRWEPRHDLTGVETATLEVSSILKEWPRITERNGVLCRSISDPGLGKVLQFIVPIKLRKLIMEAADDQWGHQGTTRTLSFIRQQCFWPGVATPVRNHIKNCFQCTLIKLPTSAVRPPMRNLLAFQPLERLAIDFLKLDDGKGKVEDVLVMTDSFTKFSIAVPCRDQTAPTVARVLRDHWFCCFGVPAQIHSDQGKNFESRLIKELCDLYQIKKTRTTAYHPQGNGQTERFNRTLCGLIKSLNADSRRLWPEFLPHLVYIYIV